MTETICRHRWRPPVLGAVLLLAAVVDQGHAQAIGFPPRVENPPADAAFGSPEWKQQDRARQEFLETTPYANLYSYAKHEDEAVRRAITTSEALWAFLTDPATAFPNRVAAALQGARVFACDRAPRLVLTIGELRAEEKLHNWGLRPNPAPNGATFVPRMQWAEQVRKNLREWNDRQRTRTILGWPWLLPAGVTCWEPGFEDPDEWSTAPWPLQVKKALEILMREAAPKMGLPPCDSENTRWCRSRCEAWLDQTMHLPCTTDDEAVLFFEATQAVRHYTSERVLARYRTFLVNTGFENAARMVLYELRDVPRAVCADAQTVIIVQVLMLDALTGPLPQRLRDEAAYGMRGLRETWDTSTKRGADAGPKRPEPATIILQASKLGLDPPEGDRKQPMPDWHSLYVYCFSACEAMDRPPFPADRRMSPDEAPKWIEKSLAWFDGNRTELERAAALEAPALNAARERLVILEAK